MPGKSLLLRILILPLLLSGCAVPDMSTQALEPGADNLDALEHNLVLLAVHTNPTQANQKVTSLTLDDPVTLERRSWAFIDNVFLKSRHVPFKIVDTDVVQYLLLDLPAGEYDLARIGFGFTGLLAQATVMGMDVNPVYRLRVVDGQPTYAGRLQARFVAITVDGPFKDNRYTFPLDHSVKVTTQFESMEGEVEFSVEDHRDEDIERAIAEYPGLAAVSFQSGLLE